MTEAEASIVAATVVFAIDRDYDGEITYGEFDGFSRALTTGGADSETAVKFDVDTLRGEDAIAAPSNSAASKENTRAFPGALD